jgi:hypothetical protein
MKILLVCILFNLPMVMDAQNEKPDPLTVRALARIEKQMGIEFRIPFPANFDPDAYMKRPLALVPIHDTKVCATRPIINPHDEPMKVEWMMGPADITKLGQDGIDCSIDLDEQGEFTRLNLIADWASDGGNHQIHRGGNESGKEFFERARLTYRFRAAKAKNPALAQLLLAGFEKMAVTIQTLRKEESKSGATPATHRD